MANIISHQENATYNHNEIPLHTSRIAKTKRTDNSQCQQGCGETGTLILCQWECKILQPLWITVQQFLIKLNRHHFTQQSHSQILMYETNKEYVHTNMFVRVKNQKQPKCPLTGEQINKLQCTHKMEYSNKKKKELLIHRTTCTNLKSTTLNHRSQSLKTIHSIIYLYKILEKAKLYRQKANQWLPRPMEGVNCKETQTNFEE